MLIVQTPTAKIKGPPARDDVRHEDGYSYYPLRRLYVEDTHDVMEILIIGMQTGQVDLAAIDFENLTNTAMTMQLVKTVLAATGFAKEQFLRLYASLFNVPISMFRVPTYEEQQKGTPIYFPATTPFVIIPLLVQHPDFVEIAKEMGNDFGALMTGQATAQPQS